MSSPHSRRQAIDFPKNTLTPPSKRKAGRPSYIYKTTARSPPTSPNSPAPKRSKSHTHSILYDSSSEESEDVEREKTQQLEDLGEESGGPDEEADSIAPYRSPSPADSPQSTNTSHRTALPTVVPSPSNSDSLDGFSFDRIAFESRESRQALAEIGGSYRAKEAIREQSQPDPHHFRPLSELVHRAIVKDGFLSGGTPLNRISSSYSTAEFPIRDIPRFFDQQPHDYTLSSNGARVSNHISVRWHDPPGLFPGDIRARHMTVELSRNATYADPDKLVWRSLFKCNGTCQRMAPEPETEADDDCANELKNFAESRRELNNPASEGQSAAKNDQAPRIAGKRTHTCEARVSVEMTVAQVGKQLCSITALVPDAHPPAPRQVLKVSPHIRGILHDAASTTGMTKTRLRIWFNEKKSTTSYATWLALQHPERLPRETDFHAAIKTVLNRSRLDGDALSAVGVVCRRRPVEVIAQRYTTDLPNGSTQSHFGCVVATAFALETAILYSTIRGLYMDSSWRNKNALRCPVTIISTLNDHHHMIPVAVMIHQSKESEAYQHMLSVLQDHVQKHAEKLLNRRCEPRFKEPRPRATLMRHCKEVSEDGFAPSFMMIDGDDAERLAIEKVFPGTPIRLCQFHFMQACISRIQSVFGKSKAGKKRTNKVVRSLRKLQRCPTESEWQSSYAVFKNDIDSVIDDGGRSLASLVQYFDRSWFSPVWRPYCIDYGIPVENTRDGPWSTNNYAEAAFRTFDRVFLCCRVNKRLDRLLLIIINTYFPYYESVPNGQSRPDPAFVEAIFGGTHIWETDAIRVCPPASKPPSTPALETAYLATTLDGSRHVCGYRSPGGRAYCNCNQFQQTGKRCAGLWALATLDVAGRVSKYERDVTAESNLLTDRSSGDVSAGTDHEEIISVFARHNILENPRACLIESGLDPTDALNYEALRELTPTSPIGRRYRTGHRDDEAEEGTLAESVGESLAKIHTNGRPPKTRPFRLSRKAKKSTLGPRKDELEASDRPTGFVNPGTDCFALSLFQLLTRQPEWRSVFGAFAAGTGRTSPVAQLLDRFQRCVDEGIVETFAELKDVLTESKLITPELSGQHDPTETLASMIDHFDTLAKASIHNDIFAAFIERTLSCSQGHIHRVERNPNGESVLYAYPDGMAHEENPGTRRLLQNTLFEQDAPNKPCPTCRETAAVEPVSRFARLGKLLAIQVVWNIDQTSRDIDSRPTKVALHYFDISLKVDLTGLFSRQKDGTQPNVAATLGGLLCKQGDRIEGGHYVAYIHHEDRWWRMDDHRAIEVRSVGDAFDEGRYPVFLLYRVAGSVSGPSPELRKHSPSSKRTPQTSTKRCSTESTRSPMDDEPISVLFDNPQLSLSLHDEVLARYSLVPWADTSTRSIFDTIATSESVTTKLESAVKMLDASMSSNMSSQYLNIPGISAPLVREHIQKYFHEPNAWWHTNVIDAVLEATESQTNHTPRGYLAFLHINFDSRGAPFHFVEDFTKGRRPWPCLPKDWLSQTTAGVISSRENTHFVAVAIFGPQKLVVVYDGREGSLDAPGLWSEWEARLHSSLRWEIRYNKVDAQVAEGWLIAPNDAQMRERLGWARQVDSHSCGPMSTAAATLVLQGLKPSLTSLGVRRTKGKGDLPSAKGLRELRSRLLLVCLRGMEEAEG